MSSSSFRSRTIQFATTFLIGIYLGANLTHFHALHNHSSLMLMSTTTTNVNDEPHEVNFHRANRTTNYKLQQQPNSEQQQQQQQRDNLENGNPSTALLEQQQHQQCQSTLQQVQQQLQECQASLSSSRKTFTQSTKNTSLLQMDTSTSSLSSSSLSQHPVCRLVLPHPIPNAMAIWSSQLARIHQASQLPNDRKYALSDFTAELLHIVSPRLPRSVKTLPHQWDSLQHVLHVGYQRYKYLKDVSIRRKSKLPRKERANAPRKVNILIMGGSLLVGTNCRKIIADSNVPGIVLPKRHCTWSNRLEKFLNQLLGPIVGVYNKKTKDYESMWDLVQVTKTAMGGTNTETGRIILEYDLLPEEARYPDIIINAYSTNDMHYRTVMEASRGNATLRDKVFEITQEYVRQVLRRRFPNTNCHQNYNDNNRTNTNDKTNNDDNNDDHQHAVPPLLLHMDDYLGNEQRGILATTELSQSVQVLANYYGFTSMSYADVVRDLVYADTRESWFSPMGWYDPSAKAGSNASKIMYREIHPGMGMHISATWVTAFTMLHLTTTFCSLEWSRQTRNSSTYDNSGDADDEEHPLRYDRVLGLPPLEGRYMIPGKPRRPPRDLLPPLLDKYLSLENITELWRNQSQHQGERTDTQWSMALSSSSSSCDKQQRAVVRCPFSWVSSLSLQQKNVTYIKEYFGRRTVANEGWDLASDHGKLGYVPLSGRNSRMTLEFEDLTQPIRTLTFFIMKSYGPRWNDSRMNITVHHQGPTTLLSHILEGFHDKQTSEIYNEPLQLKQTIEPGNVFRIQMDLVDGETFKLMGMAVCS